METKPKLLEEAREILRDAEVRFRALTGRPADRLLETARAQIAAVDEFVAKAIDCLTGLETIDSRSLAGEDRLLLRGAQVGLLAIAYLDRARFHEYIGRAAGRLPSPSEIVAIGIRDVEFIEHFQIGARQ